MPQSVSLLVPRLSGGAVSNIPNLSQALLDRNLAVDVVLENAASLPAQLLPESANRFSCGDFKSAFSILRLAAYLRRRRPAVLLADRLSGAQLAWRARRLAASGVRIFAGIHDTYSEALKRKSPDGRARATETLRRLYPRLDGLIAVSCGAARDFAGLAGIEAEAIKVIENPVVSPRMLELAGEAVAHPWLRDRTTPVVVSAGRLDEGQKDFATLIHAFALLESSSPLRLLVLGEGRDRASLEALVDELSVRACVDFPGWLDNPYPSIAAADVFVLSSRREGFGNVLVEALALGTPVVATDCPSGPAEILDGGRLGRLVPPGEPQALAGAITLALEGGRVATGVVAGIRERYSAARAAAHYLSVMGLD